MACTKHALFTDDKVYVSREMINFLFKVHVREIALFFNEASDEIGIYLRTSKNFTKAGVSRSGGDCLSVFEATFLSPSGCRRSDLEEHFPGVMLFEDYVKLQPGFQKHALYTTSQMRGGYLFEVKNGEMHQSRFRRSRVKETARSQQDEPISFVE